MALQPRIVHITQNKDTHAMKSCTPVPSLLHASHETLGVALKFYKRAFYCCLPGQTISDKYTPYIWFNFERDFLLLDSKDYRDDLFEWHRPIEMHPMRVPYCPGAPPLITHFPPARRTLTLSRDHAAFRGMSVKWFPDNERRRVRNLAWYDDKFRHTVEIDEILEKFEGLEKLYLVKEIMGHGEDWHRCYIRGRTRGDKDEDYRDAPGPRFCRSYNLSFWEIPGEENIDVKACFELFRKLGTVERSGLEPRDLPRLAELPWESMGMQDKHTYLHVKPLLDKYSSPC
ncbi:hypothetical protein NHQ30_006420 [Ciborinia camelliae]|nr:hypothetical protein NHQ30_006420 [Ciborinia camelliae]